MRTVWKWIIGVAIVLVVLALVVGGVFLLRSQFAATQRVVQLLPRNNQTPNNQNPNGTPPYYRGGPYTGPGFVMPYGRRGFPMMGGRGFGFFPWVGIIGFLFFAALVVLVVLLIVWLVRRNNRQAAMAAPMAATAVPPAAPATGTHACKNCGQPVQDNWKHCPYCGTEQ